MTDWLTPRNMVVAGLLLFLALVPVYVAVTGNAFLMTLFTRIVILAIAATSLNLILGYGGMVSFGHAVYLGVGGYAVGILAYEGVASGFAQWPVAIAVSALLALIVGALSLRTRGVYFIMITLAFAQLVYFFGVGLEAYGGDDGLTIARRSDFAGLLPNRGPAKYAWFYGLCFVLMLLVLLGAHRLAGSHFGHVLRGSRINDLRMQALGFPTYRYRLAGFVIAGAVCGLAGALLANHTEFISPAMMHWTRSGDLIVIVVLGGMGSLFGPLYGALAFLLLEELLPGLLRVGLRLLHDLLATILGADAVGPLATWSRLAEFWQIPLGVILILVVLYARGGIDSLLRPREAGGHG